jgi:hypothetical protein
MTDPVRVGELLPGVLQEVIARAGPGHDRWMEQVAQTGYCAHPVRLHGTIEHADPQTGEVRTIYSTDQKQDASLLKGCGNRRATVCPSCSATYQADSFQLLVAGLRGGKGVPETVAEHPRLFVTFTAPSFGSVHSPQGPRATVFPCHPYRQGQRCPNGRPAAGSATTPTIPASESRYAHAATRPAPKSSGKPWPVGCGPAPPSTCTALAQLAGVTEAELRGAVRRAAASVAVPCPALDEDQDVTLIACWGEQLDVRHITEAGHENELSAEQVAGYIAKYATKATEALGVTLDHRIGDSDLDELSTDRTGRSATVPAIGGRTASSTAAASPARAMPSGGSSARRRPSSGALGSTPAGRGSCSTTGPASGGRCGPPIYGEARRRWRRPRTGCAGMSAGVRPPCASGHLGLDGPAVAGQAGGDPWA